MLLSLFHSSFDCSTAQQPDLHRSGYRHSLYVAQRLGFFPVVWHSRWPQQGKQSTKGQQRLPKLLGLLNALIPGIDFSLVSLHELVALQNGNQPLRLGVPLHQARCDSIKLLAVLLADMHNPLHKPQQQ